MFPPLGVRYCLQAATKGSSDPQDMIDALEFRAKALTAGQTCDAAALVGGGICRRYGVPSGYRKPEPVAQESQCGALLPSNAA